MKKLSNTTKALLGATIFSLSSCIWASNISQTENNSLAHKLTNNVKQVSRILIGGNKKPPAHKQYKQKNSEESSTEQRPYVLLPPPTPEPID